MTNAQKELLKLQVQNENVIFGELKNTYSSALKTINDKIKILQGSNLQSKIYQLQYQKALKKQVSAILDNLTSNSYSSIQSYLEKSYEFGYLGTMYDLQKQGVPLIFPINQEDVVNSILNNTKLSKSLYDSLGVNINDLKKQINVDISRGLASDMSYSEIARSLNLKMGTGLYNAKRIVRTESGRIQSEGSYDCLVKAKDAGADVVKQWDSTLDGKTRPSHRELDGQIKEIDEPFVVNGHSALYAHGFGVASEDVNCRCRVVQRAKWLVEDEENFTKWDNENRTLIDLSGYKSYEEFKKAYYDKIDYFDEYKNHVKILEEKAPSNFDDFLSIRK